MPEKLSKELQDSLIEILKIYEKEDDEAHKAQRKNWKKNEEFWHGVQYLFWSEKDENWKSPAEISWGGDEGLEELGSYYDYVINIFRGHGEGIIAALTQQIPSLQFIPDDADDADDVLTAETYGRIADLIQRHNKAKLLALRSFFFLYINGIVASYIYKDSDFNYGSYQIPDFQTEPQTVFMCPTCDYEYTEDDLTDIEKPEKIELICPSCGMDGKPKKAEKEVPVEGPPKTLPKTRVKIDIFGALQIKVRITARNQDETPYLLLTNSVGKEQAIEAYDDKENEILADMENNSVDMPQTDYMWPNELPAKDRIKISKIWLRPSAYNLEKDKKKRTELKKHFPKGVRLEVLGKNKTFARAEEEELDSRWRVGQAGLSTYIYSDPICNPIVSIQEMRNTLANLTIETIEHGIPATFADPKVVNFDEYDKFENVPGYIYKTLPGRPNGRIGDAFYETGRAQLSKEVPGFVRQLDQDAQFALGSFPSVLGAPAQRDRATAREYEMSRTIALQRLQIAWHLFVDWYKSTLESATRLYTDVIVEDERFVQKDPQGKYINVWIRRSELSGNVGGCESEADSSFPESLSQKKAVLMDLIQLNNEFINMALYTPENAAQLQKVLALNDFKLPGQEQRFKQLMEIKDLVNSEPVSDGVPSILPDPDIDDDAVHIEACRAYLVDTTGIDCKQSNPMGYANVIFHMKAHQMNLMAKTAGMNQTPPGEPPKTTQVGVEQ